MGLIQKYKINAYLIEVIKWGLVIWLIFPVKDALTEPVAFGRVAAGVVLFVIFSGKLLYDVVIFPRQHARQSSAGRDALSMLGIVVGISLLVCVLVLFVGLIVMQVMKSGPGPVG